MPTQNFGFRLTQIGFPVSGWKAVAAFGLFLAVIASVIIFALSLLLVLAPILLVSSVAYYFLAGKSRYTGVSGKSSSPAVIDGEFRVVDDASDDAAPRHIS